MNKYTIILIIFTIAVIASSVIISGNKKSEDNKQITSVITVDKESYDFGEVDIFGGKVETTYIIKNEGEQDVKITSAITSCMCTEGKIGKMKFKMHSATGGYTIIPAGGQETLTAIYDPLAHGPDGTGKITRELTIKTNSITTPEITVKLSADVVKN
ncbi:MAG: DUF1573 domain-containing protein [Patescibacteria group bacterium]|mgnify:CR=1 FL=1